jgi:hypothetical protein
MTATYKIETTRGTFAYDLDCADFPANIRTILQATAGLVPTDDTWAYELLHMGIASFQGENGYTPVILETEENRIWTYLPALE